MATRIRASCDDCGDVELRVDDVDVRVCIDDNAGTYVFRCPSCDMAVVKDAEPRVVDLLLASGVEMTAWTMPAELPERRAGPAFTHDDLLDFHDAARGRRLAATSCSTPPPAARRPRLTWSRSCPVRRDGAATLLVVALAVQAAVAEARLAAGRGGRSCGRSQPRRGHRASTSAGTTHASCSSSALRRGAAMFLGAGAG